MVIIGHASIGENGIRGGQAGDQTGKEVCTRTWYAKNWSYVLRCKDSNRAEIMALSCEKACNNPQIGYDQSQRNTLRTQAYLNNLDLSKIKVACECDCSSLMAVCAECAGIAVPYTGNNAPTTATMRRAFTSTGMFDVFTAQTYTGASNLLKRGDILVKEGSHTVMVLTDGNAVTSPAPQYAKGNTYTTNTDLYIRETPYGEKMKHSNITNNAKIHSHFDSYGYAILNKGTRVSCLDVKQLIESTWILIPSGWICAVNKGKKYIL